jgi:geranylgeranyl diphosphate synthase type I
MALLNDAIRLGQKADPIIRERIQRYPSQEFRSPLNYHFGAGGKRVRAAITLLSCSAAGGLVKNATVPAAIVEMIHNYSLVMDDIIDRAQLRRGKPSVRIVLGDSIALLVAMTYRELLDQMIENSISKQKMRQLAVKAMIEIIDGERLDLQFEQSGRSDPYLLSHRISQPNFDRYLEMIGKKTASLFRTAGQMGAYAARRADTKTVEALGEFGWNAGLAFQIMDDVLDIAGNNTGKEPAKDVIEHKLGNATILVALKFMPSSKRKRLLSILQTEHVSRKMADEARKLIAQTPAEESCREIAKSYTAKAEKYLMMLRPSRYRHALMSLCNEMVYRTF